MKAAINAARKLVVTCMLYDQSHKGEDAPGYLGLLRLKLAFKKEKPLAKLPTCEASFEEHVKRASFLTKIWICVTLFVFGLCDYVFK